MMRRYLILLSLVPILVFFNFSIYQKEHLKTQSELIYLALVPVDPRSLMQGDYMRLRYQLAIDAERQLRQRRADAIHPVSPASHLVIGLDQRSQGTFVRFHKAGESLDKNERLLAFKLRGLQPDGQVYIHPESFFFQEGHGQAFQNARFAMIRLAPSGDHLLVGLADETGAEILPD